MQLSLDWVTRIIKGKLLKHWAGTSGGDLKEMAAEVDEALGVATLTFREEWYQGREVVEWRITIARKETRDFPAE